MKNLVFVLVAVLLPAAACGSGDVADPYGGGQNPVIPTAGLADPHAILFDGQYYLYYEGFEGGSRMMVQRMRSFTELEGDPIQLMEPEGWEIDDQLGVIEGAWMVKRDGVYYLIYSGNRYQSEDYAVGYSTSTSPIGPFERYAGNPIMSKADGVIGPGHHSVVQAPDGTLAIVYHQKRTRDEFDNRFIAVDRMGFNSDGTIWIRPTPLLEQAGN